MNHAEFPQQEAQEKSEKESKIEVAERSLRSFLALQPDEKVLIIIDEPTNKETIGIIQQALDKMGNQYTVFSNGPEVTVKEIKKLLKSHQVVVDLASKAYDSSEDIYDYIEETNNRLLTLLNPEPDLFDTSGPLNEDLVAMKERLNRMESVLKQATGFHITSSYGTDLMVPMRMAGERTWAKETGEINRPGQWDNWPGGEIFTTPDETKVNGVLYLPVLETSIASDQGVDQIVRLDIKDGTIVSIQGGASAEKLREALMSKTAEEQKETGEPWNVLRIAEIGFGANSTARPYALDPEKPYDAPGTNVAEAEKRHGTMHLAFGDAEHGEDGAEGFNEAVSHYDFVLPRNGLTVEMYTHEDDQRHGKNGRKIIDQGSINFG